MLNGIDVALPEYVAENKEREEVDKSKGPRRHFEVVTSFQTAGAGRGANRWFTPRT